MAIDYSLLLTLKSMFRDGKYGREHNKHDFDADYNNFVLMQDKLAILANYELARGGIDNLLSYLDDNVVGSAIKDACNDKRYLMMLKIFLIILTLKPSLRQSVKH